MRVQHNFMLIIELCCRVGELLRLHRAAAASQSRHVEQDILGSGAQCLKDKAAPCRTEPSITVTIYE